MASRFSIEAVFRAVDRMTRPLQKMGLNSKRFTRALRRDFARAQRQVAAFGASIKRFAGRALRIGLIGGLAAAGFAISQFVKQAAKIEDIEASFRPLLGSLEEAKILVGKLRQTAVTTPFQLEGLSEAAGTLLAFRAATKDTVIPILRMLGDTAQGSSEKLTRITQAFGKIQAIGTVSMKEIRQLVTSNIPILDILQKTLGVTIDELREMVRAGKITSKDITKAFVAMTSEGGDFFKGMEIAAKTLTGRFSTFKDNVKELAATFGDAMLPRIKEFLETAIETVVKLKDWAMANQEIIKAKFEDTIEKIIKFTKEAIRIFKIIINVIKILKPLLIAIAIAWGIYKVAMIAATIVQIALNIAMTANPIGLIIVAIGLLVGAIIWLVKNWDKVVVFLRKVWAAVVDFVVGTIKKLWNKFSELLENPFFVAVGLIFAPWLTIPGLIIKHWEPIKEFFLKLWEIIKGVGETFKTIGKFTGLDKESREARRESREEGGTQRRGRGVVTTRQSISETTNRSEIRVTNDGRTDVETDSGSIRPGGSIILQPSG